MGVGGDGHGRGLDLPRIEYGVQQWLCLIEPPLLHQHVGEVVLAHERVGVGGSLQALEAGDRLAEELLSLAKHALIHEHSGELILGEQRVDLLRII